MVKLSTWEVHLRFSNSFHKVHDRIFQKEAGTRHDTQKRSLSRSWCDQKMEDVVEVAAFLDVKLSSSLLLKIHWQDLSSFSFLRSLLELNFPRRWWWNGWLQQDFKRHVIHSFCQSLPGVISFSWSSFIRRLQSIFLLRSMLTWAGVRGMALSGSPGTKRSKTPS